MVIVIYKEQKKESPLFFDLRSYKSWRTERLKEQGRSKCALEKM